MTTPNMTEEAILEEVKTRLGIPQSDTSKDNLLKGYIAEVAQHILNVTNRKEVPPELYWTLINMVTGKFWAENPTAGELGQVTSVTESGRTVGFKDTRQNLSWAEVQAKYQNDIMRFRLPYRFD